MLEHETDPLKIGTIIQARKQDLSVLDTFYIVRRLLLCVILSGSLYYVISGRGRVWGILYLVYSAVWWDFYYIALILNRYFRVRRYRDRYRYSQAGLDPF